MFKCKLTRIIFTSLLLVSYALSPSIADPTKFAAANEVFKNNCYTCHSAWAKFTEQTWINSGLIIPQNVKESPLILRIKYGKLDTVLAAEDMPNPKGSPKWEAFTQAEYYLIRDWINTLEGTIGGGDDGSELGNGEIYRSSDEALRLGDRFFIKSVLENIYGTEVSAILDKYIFRKLSAFGGACDLKEHYTYIYDTRTYSNYMNCEGVDFLDDRAPLVPPSSALREGLRLKACTEINMKNDRVTAAVQKLGGNVSSWPTAENVAAAHQLFFPGRRLGGLAQTALLGVSNGAKTQFPSKPLEGWRYLLLTLCKSPDWQAP